jgi:hypothetical protein
MPFEPIRLEDCFSELHGFVLLDPARLDAFFGGKAQGTDLLARFTQTDDVLQAKTRSEQWLYEIVFAPPEKRPHFGADISASMGPFLEPFGRLALEACCTRLSRC